MGLKLSMTIEGARAIDNGVWKARLEPEEVATLGECKSKTGPYSVLLLESAIEYNPEHASLTFDPNATRLLNVGSTAQILVLSHSNSAKSVSKAGSPAPVNAASAPAAGGRTTASSEKSSCAQLPSSGLTTGDKLFLSELPPDLRDLGENLMTQVRSHFPGELCFEPRSAKFDETPNIFWTVKILPHEKALRITVRGKAESFPNDAGIELKQDKYGYSAFLLVRPSQVSAAMRILAQGKKNMQL
ncbi:MAG TPA: hypothetical protein ACFCUC_04635 [Desulfobacterales bacterium]